MSQGKGVCFMCVILKRDLFDAEIGWELQVLE